MPGPEPRICLGMVVGAHGVKGQVRIKPFTEDARSIAAYGPVSDEAGLRRFEVRVIALVRGTAIAELSGVRDRTAAEGLTGLRLYVPRAALPPAGAEEFYHADLIGLAAERADGRPVGQVTAVFDHGAGAYLEIEGAGGARFFVPFTRRAVPMVDAAGGRLVIDPPGEIGASPEEETGP